MFVPVAEEFTMSIRSPLIVHSKSEKKDGKVLWTAKTRDFNFEVNGITEEEALISLKRKIEWFIFECLLKKKSLCNYD